MSTGRMKSEYFVMSAILFLLISHGLILLIDQKTINLLTAEDGVFEHMSAGFFLLTSVIFFVCFFTKRAKPKFLFFGTQKNYFFFFLAIVFFFGFGEEISWGQRIIGFETPDVLDKLNMQKEFNIHNLPIFNGSDAAGRRKSFWSLFLTIDRMFSVFWLVYCFVIPILAKINITFCKWLKKLCLPTMPLWLGIFFPLNYLVSRVLALYYDSPIFTKIILIEIKEAGFAFLFLLASIYMFQNDFVLKCEKKM
jgi:hypothetical protein